MNPTKDQRKDFIFTAPCEAGVSDTQAKNVEPLTVTIAACVARTGWSRSEVYRLLSARILKARKMGRKTLVEWQSVLAHAAALPAAEFRGQLRHGTMPPHSAQSSSPASGKQANCTDKARS